MAGRTGQALERLWPRYYEKSFKPSTMADRVRLDLLRGKTIGPFVDKVEGARISGLITTMERLGYDVERGERGGAGAGMTYRILNLDHRPSPEQFAAAKQGSGASASTNGHGPTRSVRAAAPMLPRLGEHLAVTALGFDAEGKPFLVVTGPDGWRYSCSLDSAEAPRTT